MTDSLDERLQTQTHQGESQRRVERPHLGRPCAHQLAFVGDVSRIRAQDRSLAHEPDGRQEQNDVRQRIDGVLDALGETSGENVDAHVRVLLQGVGRPQHEQRAVQHVDHVERPEGRRVEAVARDDFVERDEGQGEKEHHRRVGDRADARLESPHEVHEHAPHAGPPRASCTTRPPTMVMSATMSGSDPSSHVNGSTARTARSASLPGSMLPFSCSSKVR